MQRIILSISFKRENIEYTFDYLIKLMITKNEGSQKRKFYVQSYLAILSRLRLKDYIYGVKIFDR